MVYTMESFSRYADDFIERCDELMLPATEGLVIWLNHLSVGLKL